MPTHLYVAAAASGKTAWALELARTAAHGLQQTPRVIVPTRLQVRACRRRLAETGGAMGVRVMTFDQLCTQLLSGTRHTYVELAEPVRYRVLRAVVDRLPLDHYAALVNRPGFVQILQELICELKSARVSADAFASGLLRLGSPPRLEELAKIYSEYETWLETHGWVDRQGIAWLASEALEGGETILTAEWPLVIVDGFDDFSEVQLAVLRGLARQVGKLVITLTGTVDSPERLWVHSRFAQTRRRLCAALEIEAEPLPQLQACMAGLPAYLESGLYRAEASSQAIGAAVKLIAAPDRMREVRAALRWLKQRLVGDGMASRDLALMARDIGPYRDMIVQIAAEFGLPLHLASGVPLGSVPVISALLDLMRLCLPVKEGSTELSVPRRLVVEAWRSPYFDWTVARDPLLSIGSGDAERLDRAARAGRVLVGTSQWEEALVGQASRAGLAVCDKDAAEEQASSAGGDAEQLLVKFREFVRRIAPPTGARSVRDFVCWLEDLIGADPEAEPRVAEPVDETSLHVAERARGAGPAPTFGAAAEWDVAALCSLKELLRGLVWAEGALGSTGGIEYARFFGELEGAVQAASCQLSWDITEDILVCDVLQARGVPFRAVAILGLAEGEFPKAVDEDPFLRDRDRLMLSETARLPLRPSTVSTEAEFFYEAVTRATDTLLLTRSRLADNGAEWQASPFWEELQRLAPSPVEVLSTATAVAPMEVASWPEVWQTAVTRPEQDELRTWACRQQAAEWAALELGGRVIRERAARTLPSVYAGQLTELAAEFAKRYARDSHVWSASRLEAYRQCPFRFFVGSVLELEPVEEPQAGLDARQLGNIYHRILEQLYKAPGLSDPRDVSQLQRLLPEVATKVLDAAPEQEGFRATAWWVHTRREIETNVALSLEALAVLDAEEDYTPIGHEARFFEPNDLRVPVGEDGFRLHGVIDRVDRAGDGRVRIIDYKTAGPTRFSNKAVSEGLLLQLSLYALAAKEALGLGVPADGFYWHVQHGEASPFRLSKYRHLDGRDAMQVAVDAAWEAVCGVRAAQFAPSGARGDCPSYCPAAGFCPLYHEGFRG